MWTELVADATPSPSPSLARVIDPNIVSPGALGLLSFLLLVALVVGIWFSMSKHLRRIDVGATSRTADPSSQTNTVGQADGES